MYVGIGFVFAVLAYKDIRSALKTDQQTKEVLELQKKSIELYKKGIELTEANNILLEKLIKTFEKKI